MIVKLGLLIDAFVIGVSPYTQNEFNTDRHNVFQSGFFIIFVLQVDKICVKGAHFDR